MRRRSFIGVTAGAVLGIPIINACSSSGGGGGTSTSSVSATAGSNSALNFDAKAFTEESTTVTMADGEEVTVNYKLWKGIVYVANPVDAEYQSMNIKQPTSVNGKEVDASGAPIVFAMNIGGYTSSAVNAEQPGGMPGGGMPPGGGAPPAGAGGDESGSGVQMSAGKHIDLGDYALASGLVVVNPGARGRDNVNADGVYFGKAPAAIVDLKAAVRYLKANSGVVPGNTDRIVSSGSSAGGALSVLLGASGGSDLYQKDLVALGAADASDVIYAVAGYCPITDLENADAAYEWCFGDATNETVSVNATVSEELRARFPQYMERLGLKDDQGRKLTADNLAEHMLSVHLRPSAKRYLDGLSDEDRAAYVAQNPWVEGDFTWEQFIDHTGRGKGAPAFDALDLSSGENSLFGNENTNARHFTTYAQGGDLEEGVEDAVTRMNPMGFILDRNPQRAQHWFLRVGAKDTDTSFSIVSNLASALSNAGDAVDTSYYWDAGHGANEDPDAFIAWVKSL